jgi:hypothetical protein
MQQTALKGALVMGIALQLIATVMVVIRSPNATQISAITARVGQMVIVMIIKNACVIQASMEEIVNLVR